MINHFYRGVKPVPWPYGNEDRPEPPSFEIQQRIEARFRRVLNFVLSDPNVNTLTVVSHSQGTMIAVDVLSLSAHTPRQRTDALARLQPPHDVAAFRTNLITMGSPLMHLYEHYFPSRYQPLSRNDWADLLSIICDWINIYRIDDYIGTYITDSDGFQLTTQKLPRNTPFGPGGHTGYWTQEEIFSDPRVSPLLPG